MKTVNKNKLKILKRNFLLLEVLIAFALVLMCIFPLLSTNVLIAAKEKQLMKEMEIDHVLNLVLVHLTQNLYENKFEWHDLIDGLQETLTDEVLKELNVPSSASLKINYLIKLSPQKKGNEDAVRHFVDLKISFKSNQDTYHFPFKLFLVRTLPEANSLPLQNAKIADSIFNEENTPHG